ncbi:pyridoxamine 5'-phosphate oxidase [Sulfurovum sp. XTW-4]|uniref:Pyridoxamine 5'-phosphate oxidase n=1 Tax=Sulfurovum xiamenensis TaxID=3019066 RepID=A0ABT7QR96_9BACT|nr:pyridoxamine 5'-phosphate oxidase [Sulfurovum xiamenensis]MDM5263597.1 pyridoxamine 5'-phosphate oxidase [Sulfurovum xiamenensis]
MLDLQEMRTEYIQATLDESTVPEDPFILFETWFAQAVETEVKDPNSMILATSSKENIPNIRTVLLKIFDEKGFVFFTNYNSVKAKEIEENPHVALEFLWLDLERQVRVIGTCEKISTSESMSYFMKRSRGSQIGAWVSKQSSVISSRKMLQMQIEKMKQKFANGSIPLPDFWGGYRVIPSQIEFWQGRANRLHDRILYKRENGGWKIERLAP